MSLSEDEEAEFTSADGGGRRPRQKNGQGPALVPSVGAGNHRRLGRRRWNSHRQPLPPSQGPTPSWRGTPEAAADYVGGAGFPAVYGVEEAEFTSADEGGTAPFDN